MIYSFDEEVAKAVGVEAAVILDKFAWWIRRNEANGENFHEGRYWTYNSTKAMEDMFPFFNRWKIERILKKLINDGYLLTGNFNKMAFDRTLWYTLSDKGNELVHTANHDLADSQNDISQIHKMTFSENAKPIPVSTNSNTIDSNMRKSAKAGKDAKYEEMFTIFYKAYPKKKDKAKAFAAFKKLKPTPELLETILKSLEWQKQTMDWQKQGGQFIPYPASYLNGRRWEDEQQVSISAPKPEEQISGAEFMRREEERHRQQVERDMRLAAIARQQEEQMRQSMRC